MVFAYNPNSFEFSSLLLLAFPFSNSFQNASSYLLDPPPGGQRHRDAHRAQVPFHRGEQGETANRTSRAEASLSHVITGQE